MPRRLPLALLVVPLALVVSACGSSVASPGSSETADPSDAPATTQESAAPSADAGAPEAGTDLTACEIVTAADVAAALGLEAGAVADGELTESPTVLSPGHTDCRYEGDWGGVVVSLTPEDGANLYDAARGSYADASDRVVTGADGAFWSEDNGRGFFWKGAVTVLLQVGFLTEGGDRDAIVTELGQAAMDRVD